jgi:hypothetical protein
VVVAGVGEGVAVGDGRPSRLAIAFLIFVISEAVSHDGYFGGTIRSCLTDALWAFPNRFTRFGSDARGRSVQVKPFAALKSEGASRIVPGPI